VAEAAQGAATRHLPLPRYVRESVGSLHLLKRCLEGSISVQCCLCYLGVFRNERHGCWKIRAPQMGQHSFATEKEAASAYREWRARDSQPSKASTSQHPGDGEPRLPDSARDSQPSKASTSQHPGDGEPRLPDKRPVMICDPPSVRAIQSFACAPRASEPRGEGGRWQLQGRGRQLGLLKKGGGAWRKNWQDLFPEPRASLCASCLVQGKLLPTGPAMRSRPESLHSQHGPMTVGTHSAAVSLPLTPTESLVCWFSRKPHAPFVVLTAWRCDWQTVPAAASR
jgi:hypothetical protein